MTNQLKRYLKEYEMVKSSDPNKFLVYVPYEKHFKVDKYLRTHNIQRSLRYTFDYSLAVFCI